MSGGVYRRDSIYRAFKTIEALNWHNGVTARELSDFLGLRSNSAGTNYHNAMKWIDAASTVMPVAEIGKRKSKKFGIPATAYKIMDDL
jgi:hypothetical protein